MVSIFWEVYTVTLQKQSVLLKFLVKTGSVINSTKFVSLNTHGLSSRHQQVQFPFLKLWTCSQQVDSPSWDSDWIQMHFYVLYASNFSVLHFTLPESQEADCFLDSGDNLNTTTVLQMALTHLVLWHCYYWIGLFSWQNLTHFPETTVYVKDV